MALALALIIVYGLGPGLGLGHQVLGNNTDFIAHGTAP